MESVKSSGYIYTCTICGKEDTWKDSWIRYCSIKDEEDGLPYLTCCSNKCMNKAKELGLTNDRKFQEYLRLQRMQKDRSKKEAEAKGKINRKPDVYLSLREEGDILHLYEKRNKRE